MTDEHDGGYEWEPGTDRQHLWWVPPDAFPRQALHTTREPRLGAEPAAEAAKAILRHVTGDERAAEQHHRAFARDLLAHSARGPLVAVPVDRVTSWLDRHDLELVAGWTRHGPGPVITRADALGEADRYLVSLDGHPVLDVEVLPPASDGGLDARIGIHDRRELGGYAWDDTVQVALPEDLVHALATDRRVTAEALPFGGWAIQVDDFDVVIVERTGEHNDHTRIAVYDRTPGADFLATETTIPHQPVATSSGIAERLQSFAAPDPAIALAR